jgi:hypothetical protein
LVLVLVGGVYVYVGGVVVVVVVGDVYVTEHVAAVASAGVIPCTTACAFATASAAAFELAWSCVAP